MKKEYLHPIAELYTFSMEKSFAASNGEDTRVRIVGGGGADDIDDGFLN